MPPAADSIAKAAPLGVNMLSTQLAKSTSLPSLSRTHGGHNGNQSQALMATGTLSLFMGSSVSSGRLVAQGAWGFGPPKAGAHTKKIPKGTTEKFNSFEVTSQPATQFRRFYERQDLPIAIRFGTNPGVEWKVEPERLDYVYLLPIFFDGLMEKENPYAILAYGGLQDMLNASRGKEPSLVCPAVPSVVLPLKRALKTKDRQIMCRAINMLQLMLRCDPRAGEQLVPYYRQILPVFNLYCRSNKNLGDSMDYSQRKRENLGELISETLELLERTGGEDAFINIKYMIPTYQSCMIG